MHKLRKARLFAVTAAVAVGLLGLAPAAIADTGPDGFTILYASAQQEAHICNVISQNDTKYQAVVCADLITYSNGTDYFVAARAEAYCQDAAAPHDEVACNMVNVTAQLSTASGGLLKDEENCGGSGTTCDDVRTFAETGTWDYRITAGQDGGCIVSPTSAFDVWGLVKGYPSTLTTINTPDGFSWQLGLKGAMPNDGVNESTGHFYICP